MSAVEGYQKTRRLRWSQRTQEQWALLADKADAAIAELEERIVELGDRLEGQRIVADGTMKRLVAEGNRRIAELEKQLAGVNETLAIEIRSKMMLGKKLRESEARVAALEVDKARWEADGYTEAWDRVDKAEAENARLRLNWQREAKNANRLDVELEAAEALSQAHCKDCANWTEFLGLLVGRCEAVGRFSSRNYLETPDTFVCRWWAARDESEVTP